MTVVVAVVLGGSPSVATAEPGAAAPLGGVGPGALMLTPVDGRTASACTANFVFASGGARYLGYAAHCAGTGDGDVLSGCAEPSLPLGSEVRIGDGFRGRLAYSSWLTMQNRDERNEGLCLFNDFALVALDPGTPVEPSVPGLGGPVDLDTDGTRPGEAVFSVQPNNDNRALKVGESRGDSDGGLTHQVSTTPAGNPGDSGSGYLDADGEAFGVLSTQYLDDGSNGVTDLARALDYTSRFGGLGPVELVPGSAPFTR